MDMNKFLEFFNPASITDPIHIIGCGAIGSTLAVMLTRAGLTNIRLYDFDIVTPHNIANQQFTHEQIGMPKTKALSRIMTDVNPKASPIICDKWEPGSVLKGYIFLAVDSIELRKQILEDNKYNGFIDSVYDFRMRLKDAQHYAANWKVIRERNNLIQSTDFTDAEASANNEVNACNMTLSIMPTVQTIVSIGVANFINHINGLPLKRMVQASPFDFIIND